MGGRGIDVVSVFLTLGYGGWCGFVRLVFRLLLVPPRGYCSRRRIFASTVPLCLRVRGWCTAKSNRRVVKSKSAFFYRNSSHGPSI